MNDNYNSKQNKNNLIFFRTYIFNLKKKSKKQKSLMKSLKNKSNCTTACEITFESVIWRRGGGILELYYKKLQV